MCHLCRIRVVSRYNPSAVKSTTEKESYMGSYACHCGSGVKMGHGFSPYEAHIIADQDIDDFMAASRYEIQNPYTFVKANIYQCAECSRLIIVPNNEEPQQTFAPDKIALEPLLRSVKRENWARPLYAEWSDKDCRGTVRWGFTGVDSEDNGFACLKSWQEVQELYYQVFWRLSRANRLRGSRLILNGEDVHTWRPHKK